MSFILDENLKKLRIEFINSIENLKDFKKGINFIEENLLKELNQNKLETLLNHIRLCADIPEIFTVNSTQEKVYSKYTDIILSEIFNYLGFKTTVLKERGDFADVDVYFKDEQLSFVADAKTFRASRTAKNAKDFKVQSMVKWKKGKPFALLVCPIHQLPTVKSQIYRQAIDGDVCILTYTHLAIILNLKTDENENDIQVLFENIFRSIKNLKSSKNAYDYWNNINSIIFGFSEESKKIWNKEKKISDEAIIMCKEIALMHCEQLIDKTKKLTLKQAIAKLKKPYNNKIKKITGLENNDILNIK